MLIKELPINTRGIDYFVGDIHGQYQRLMQALDKVQFNPKQDRLISTGDIIDRGPDSEKCLKLLLKPWFHMVKGNHEWMMQQSLLEDDQEAQYNWMNCGGQWMLDDNDPLRFMPYAERIAKLPLALRIGDIGVLHGEFFGEFNWINTIGPYHQERLMWGRKRFYHQDDSLVRGIKAVVVGHTPVGGEKRPVLGNTVYIDTGFWHKKSALPQLLNSQEILRLIDENKTV